MEPSEPTEGYRWADPILFTHHRAGAADGPLAGTTFAVKDVFAVAGLVRGAGNPTWAARSAVATTDAAAVEALLAAGADLVGTTISDELAYSLSGTNVHYGTPVNTAAPGRVPGGSSSGSAAAVAAGRCDIALGTDTAGSVRVPASYCGVWGMRPTHGRIPVEGVVPLAPSFDTVGWFAASAELLQRAGSSLLGAAPPAVPPASALVVAADVVALLDDDARVAFEAAAGRLAAVTGLALGSEEVAGPDTLARWVDAFRFIQGAEAWAAHGAFVSTDPAMGPGVRARFEAAAAVSVDQVAGAVAVRESCRRRMEALTLGGRILLLPAAASVAPMAQGDPGDKDEHRRRTLLIASGISLAGVPAVSAPLASVGGLPLGVCLVGAPWSDEVLLDVVVT
jgi:Asp-tRNA(Asn)/Glu-tRNA(Gln) amidotransferase A subunit family amidase